jgi:hypothetical protein
MDVKLVLSLILREEHILRVSEKRVLTRIFGPKGEEVAGGWRRLHNEELHNLYTSPNIVTVIKSKTEIGGECSTHRGDEKFTQN